MDKDLQDDLDEALASRLTENFATLDECEFPFENESMCAREEEKNSIVRISYLTLDESVAANSKPSLAHVSIMHTLPSRSRAVPFDSPFKKWSKYNIIPHPSHQSHHGSRNSDSDNTASSVPESDTWSNSEDDDASDSRSASDDEGHVAMTRRDRSYQADILFAGLLEYLCETSALGDREAGSRLYRGG